MQGHTIVFSYLVFSYFFYLSTVLRTGKEFLWSLSRQDTFLPLYHVHTARGTHVRPFSHRPEVHPLFLLDFPAVPCLFVQALFTWFHYNFYKYQFQITNQNDLYNCSLIIPFILTDNFLFVSINCISFPHKKTAPENFPFFRVLFFFLLFVSFICFITECL